MTKVAKAVYDMATWTLLDEISGDFVDFKNVEPTNPVSAWQE